MRFDIIHRTRYEYKTPVRESFNEVRLQPVTNEHQTVEHFLLKVLPPVPLKHYTDLYLNRVHYFDIPAAHQSLLVEAVVRVSTRAPRIPDGPESFPLARVAECARMERCFDYLQPSHYVAATPEAWRMALDITVGKADLWEASIALMEHIADSFQYDSSATNVHTTMDETLAGRRGVCQDFAHVLIGLCRSIGIPALYVSGYFYNGPKQSLSAPQASHAWCEVFVPGTGWVGLDPTHRRVVDERYVKVAVGRDYHDVPPVRGSYKGTQQRSMAVEVEIDELF
jgi:transglutaminase-like putative cysteine protease